MRVGAPRQHFERIMLHQSLAEALDLVLQEWMGRQAARPLVVLDLRSQEVYYQNSATHRKLGCLEKRILLMLANETLSGAEIAKMLQARHHRIYVHPLPGGGSRFREAQTWHQAVYRALKGLRRKGLVETWTALGEILAESQIMRGFYTLNPEKVMMALPVRSQTRIEFQRAKERAQREAIQREQEGIRIQRLSSPKPSTRLKALIGRAREEVL